MKLSECFYSIQGEGMTVGKPLLFIRMSGCTLKCSFCDTKYHTRGRKLLIQDKLLMRKYKRWCITGGEPLLQQEELISLISKYRPEWVEIETNGTIIPNSKILKVISQFNISPKEKRHQLGKQFDTTPKILENNNLNNIDRIIKFVYVDKMSEKFIKNIIKKYKISNLEVWIMPEGATKKQIRKNVKKVWKFCISNQFNYSPRLQVEIWGVKKKV